MATTYPTHSIEQLKAALPSNYETYWFDPVRDDERAHSAYASIDFGPVNVTQCVNSTETGIEIIPASISTSTYTDMDTASARELIGALVQAIGFIDSLPSTARATPQAA
ncbi:MAG: hypothetical protein WAO49_02725 [Arcanobacterium sp.]